MQTQIGCDIVYITRFERVIERTPDMIEKIFLPQEIMGGPSVEHLAGVFAAKEACIKGLSLRAGSWHDIIIKYQEDRRPYYEFSDTIQNIVSHDVSISHDGEYAIAYAIFILENRL